MAESSHRPRSRCRPWYLPPMAWPIDRRSARRPGPRLAHCAPPSRVLPSPLCLCGRRTPPARARAAAVSCRCRVLVPVPACPSAGGDPESPPPRRREAVARTKNANVKCPIANYSRPRRKTRERRERGARKVVRHAAPWPREKVSVYLLENEPTSPKPQTRCCSHHWWCSCEVFILEISKWRVQFFGDALKQKSEHKNSV